MSATMQPGMQTAQALGGPGGNAGPPPIMQQVKAATTACGQLVQMMKRMPGVDQAKVDAAGKQVGQSIMALLAVARGGGQAPGAAPQMPPQGGA